VNNGTGVSPSGEVYDSDTAVNCFSSYMQFNGGELNLPSATFGDEMTFSFWFNLP